MGKTQKKDGGVGSILGRAAAKAVVNSMKPFAENSAKYVVKTTINGDQIKPIDVVVGKRVTSSITPTNSLLKKKGGKRKRNKITKKKRKY